MIPLRRHGDVEKNGRGILRAHRLPLRVMNAEKHSALARQLGVLLADLLRDFADGRPVDLRSTIQKQGLQGDEWLLEATTLCLAATRLALRADQRYSAHAVEVTTQVLHVLRLQFAPAVGNALPSYVASRLPAYHLGCFEYTLTRGTPEAVAKAIAGAAGAGTDVHAFVQATTEKLSEWRAELLAAGLQRGDSGHDIASLSALAEDPFDALQLMNTTILTFRYAKGGLDDIPHNGEGRPLRVPSDFTAFALTREADRVAIREYEHIRPAPTWGPVRCFARFPGAARTCTLAKGHDGPHVAHTFFKKVVAVWTP
jgi:hypothetical protein